MTRPPLVLSRALAVPLAAVLIIGLADVAWAQTEAKSPGIDEAPSRVAFRSAATIRGRLDGGMPGDEVALERRRAGEEWRIFATETVDESETVTFRLDDLRRSADYRLSHTDELSGEYSASDDVRVRVVPRLTFRVRPGDVFQGREVRVAGALYPKVPGRDVLVEQKVDGQWRAMGRAAVRDGRFSHTFSARHTGYRRVRVRFTGDAYNSGARRRRALRVYRRALATWYGPGFYGRRTACGKRLSSDTLGVAHRTLPCGTRVSVLFRGRTVTVPVIDRGPYTSAEYDLTARTARRLGFEGKATVGVTRAP